MTKQLLDTYESAHIEAAILIDGLRTGLCDTLAPESSGIHWGHVGDLSRVIELLTEANKILNPERAALKK
jgi:hypothetical protein